MILQMEAVQLKAMADAAEAAFPAEACGLIVGRGKGQLLRVTDVIAAPNLLADRIGRFELDPAVRLRVEKALREVGGRDRIIGHYHSHADGSAEPSATDRAMVFEPDLAWVIVGVSEGQAIQLLAHRFDPKREAFRSVPIRLRSKNSACAEAEHPA